jgi:hypothetical protein
MKMQRNSRDSWALLHEWKEFVVGEIWCKSVKYLLGCVRQEKIIDCSWVHGSWVMSGFSVTTPEELRTNGSGAQWLAAALQWKWLKYRSNQPSFYILPEQLRPHIVNYITPWPEFASELYRPSDRRLSTKLVPTFLRIECATWLARRISYSRNLGFLDCSHYFFFQVAPQLYSRGWVEPRSRPTTQKIW